jgi:hypothetical protein
MSQAQGIPDHDDLREDGCFQKRHPVGQILDVISGKNQASIPGECDQENGQKQEVENEFGKFMGEKTTPGFRSFLGFIVSRHGVAAFPSSISRD